MDNGRSKVFQDATQGYISVDELYVKNLIDTEYMQREKSVSQVGLRSIFSGANHDRFSHSMGVYNVGRQVYAALKKNVLYSVKNEQNVKRYEDLLNRYEVLFYIACFLHDIGHPALSHTLEYIYNNDYIDLSSEESKDLTAYVSHLIQRYQESKGKPVGKETYLEKKFLSALWEKENKKDLGRTLKAAPHEIMGAYQILALKNLQTAIKNILDGKGMNNISDKLRNEYIGFVARMITGCRYDLWSAEAVTYDFADTKNTAIDKRTICSLRNCIISLLNGKFDADSIDYLNRNAHFAGYATNSIDINRLCTAFSVRFKDGIFTECIAKSALSSLVGVVQARNFEPKWLYSHHKVAYFNEVLIKYLMKMSGEYMFFAHQEKIEEYVLKRVFNLDITKVFSIDKKQKKYLEERYKAFTYEKCDCDINKTTDIWRDMHLSKSARNAVQDLKTGYYAAENVYARNSIRWFGNYLLAEKSWNEEKIKAVAACINEMNNMMSLFKYSFISAILSPMNPLKIEMIGFPNYVLYKTTDSGIEKLLNDIRESKSFLKQIRGLHENDESEKTWSFKCDLYEKLLEEYSTRNYRSSLWKSYEEYILFIRSVAKGTPFTVESVHEAFMQLILTADESTCSIEFENLKRARASNKDKKELEAIYVNNYEDGEIASQIKDYHKIFNFLGQGMIIRFYKCKYKSFDDLLIQFAEEYVKLGEINLDKPQKDFWFPYIYYCEETLNNAEYFGEKKSKETREKLLESLRDNLRDYLTMHCGKERSMDIEQINFLDGKVIRDSVHGDIFIETRFLKLVESRAFQRLHRIRQLATANQVFPEAVHTRFAHSLGTFHVMKRIVEHFCDVFKQLGLQYEDSEKDVVLVSALLHDIGHGPLSHAFEKVCGNVKKHEEWTNDIILQDPELNDILDKNFGPSFGSKVVACLNHVCHDSTPLQYVFTELISSNLDADRIDYMMRDSLNTGEKFGVFDLQKLISSMMLTEYNGRLRVAVDINALSAVEQFIAGRFNMYSMVYFAPYKLLSEKLFAYICEEIVNKSNIYADSEKKGLRKIGQQLQSLSICRFASGKSTVEEYLQMDDYSIMHDITQGANLLQSAGDEACANLLECFLYRKGYKRKHIHKNSCSDYDKFRKQISNKFQFMNKDNPFEQLKYSVITLQQAYCAYQCGNDNEILVIYNNGEIKPFSESSKFFDKKESTDKLWETNYVAVYLNEKMLINDCKKIKGADVDTAKEIEKYIESYDLINHTEIENKYTVNLEMMRNAKQVLRNKELPTQYHIKGEVTEKRQKDVYFDTKSHVLASNGYALRCREIQDRFIFTLKKPGNVGKSEDETQFIRLEFEVESDSSQMTENIIKFLNQHNLLEELQVDKGVDGFDYKDLQQIVQIENKRMSCTVENEIVPDFVCEVSVDDVEYTRCDTKVENNTIVRASDYQVEIELKSSYIYRINLNDFAEKFCSTISDKNEKPRKSHFSKYITALQKLGLFTSKGIFNGN